MLIPYALSRALSGVEADFTDGVQQRDFVHVDDVAAAIASAVQQSTSGFQAVNIGTGTATRVCDVLHYIAQLLNARHLLRMGRISRRATEPLVQFADVSRAAELFGWRARTSWREGIEQLCTVNREALAWTA
jgi:nucleoside-diphosphate-sugar epimerase